jgi:cytochrome P450 family 6
MVFIYLVAAVALLLFFLNNRQFEFWKRRGFKQLDPVFFFGNALPVMTLRKSLGEFMQEIYNNNKEHRAVGIYVSYNKALVINDPKLVQDIMIRDFTSFHDRPMPVDEVNDPLSAHLFSVQGQKWRDLRVKLSPTFTSGKLKTMFPIIRDCGKVLEDYLVKNVKNGVDVFEFRDLMARFNTNIISSVAFGIENDCINEPDHIFRKMGAKIFDPSIKNGLRAVFSFFAHQLFYKVNLKSVDKDVEEFIFSIVKQNVELREKGKYTRNDFMQLLVQLKNQGYVSADSEKDTENGSKESKKLDLNSLAAQVFVFFIAGKLILTRNMTCLPTKNWFL